MTDERILQCGLSAWRGYAFLSDVYFSTLLLGRKSIRRNHIGIRKLKRLRIHWNRQLIHVGSDGNGMFLCVVNVTGTQAVVMETCHMRVVFHLTSRMMYGSTVKATASYLR
jgi:hypothetical protein